ncbi:hypothetical protein C8R43DRAFT_1122905 [Mycena crocata]|nr:hypothetical protein C8R43DRAFT_1122905 [Mycena crocata]
MSTVHGAQYDRALLAQAPPATRAQLQEGYDSVLLVPNRRAKRTESDLALKVGSYEPKTHTDASAALPVFWRRRWKSILGALIALVVLVAIVGGAVGAAARRRGDDARTQTAYTTETQGVGTSMLSGGTDESGVIFGGPPVTTTSASLSLDSVVVATEPIASSDIFAQVTVAARRHSRR